MFFKPTGCVRDLPDPVIFESLEVLDQAQQEILRLQDKNSQLKTEIDNFEDKCNILSQENNFLVDSLEESKQSAAALTATINILNDKIMKAEIEASKHHFKKDELEASIKQLKKKYNEVQKESEKNVKDLVKSKKVNEKETYNLNRNLENARSTIKSLK